MAGDPLWYYKVLGLHCDGTNGSTTFTDVCGKTVTANGNAQISTAQYPALTGKTSSAYFDGNGDYLSIPDSADWDFGTGDFAIRMRVRFSSHTTVQCLVSNYLNPTTGFSLQWRSETNTLRFGCAGDPAHLDVSWTPTDNIWYVIEVVRIGTSLFARVDGSQIGSPVTNSTNITGSTNPLLIGSLFAGSYIQPFHGYVSEVEVVKGTAINTSDYTPSTDPFADEYVSISGTVQDSTSAFASRLVRVYRRDTGSLVGEVVSNESTGTYKVIAANSGTTTPRKHFAVCHDPSAISLYRVLGLHCDGTNGSTTFTDVCGKTVTANGNAQISTAQYPALTGKTSSGYFDGSGDYLSIAPSSDFNFGTGDFTIRMRWRPGSLDTAQALVYHTDDSGATGSGEFVIVYNTSLGLRFYLNAGGSGSVDQGSTSGWSTGTWYDVEITRHGTTLTIRRDGTSIASGTCSAQVGTSDKSTYLMGETFDPLYSTGYISEVEFYKGISLHTANFTPSTDPFTDSTTATENALIYDNITPH
jgi:hypothetical protein